MSITMKEKFDAMRPGESLSFLMTEARVAFAAEHSHDDGDSFGTHFARLIREHQVSHYISVCGDYLIVTRKAAA